MSMNTPPLSRPSLTIPEALAELLSAIRSKREAAAKAIEKSQAEVSRYDAVIAQLERAVKVANDQPLPKRKWSRRTPGVEQAEQIAREVPAWIVMPPSTWSTR